MFIYAKHKENSKTTWLPLRHRGIIMVQPVGIEPTSMPLQGTAITISAKVACCWRKAEESNPIPFPRTWFSRPVAGPSPLHYFPLSGAQGEI